jgi:hypothetical protein
MAEHCAGGYGSDTANELDKQLLSQFAGVYYIVLFPATIIA